MAIVTTDSVTLLHPMHRGQSKDTRACLQVSKQVHRRVAADLVGEDSDVLVERLRRADVAAGDARLARRTRRQLAFLEYQRQQREQRVTAASKPQTDLWLNSTTRARPDPTGPARTFLRPGSPRNSVRVRAGPRGSGRVRSGRCSGI